jgi:hypothetical protein
MAANKAKHLKTMYALSHHAKNIKPVADALVYALAGSGLTHKFDKVMARGQNTWYLDVVKKSGTTRYHLRAWTPFKTLFVKDDYRKGAVVARLETETDVLRFVNSL